jgi:hypothetical protein
VSCLVAAEAPPVAMWQSHKHGSAKSIVHPSGQEAVLSVKRRSAR